MKIQTWHTLAVLSNFSFLLGTIIAVIMLFEDSVKTLIAVAIILIIQVSWNLLLYAIPKMIPVFEKK